MSNDRVANTGLRHHLVVLATKLAGVSTSTATVALLNVNSVETSIQRNANTKARYAPSFVYSCAVVNDVSPFCACGASGGASGGVSESSSCLALRLRAFRANLLVGVAGFGGYGQFFC